MALEQGTQLGSYVITGRLGVGGMGEVYRAKDTALDRDVAIKVLPDSQRLDAEATMRLEREAKLLAGLNHPNIATLHGLETRDDFQALVMELVDGESLEDRIARAPHGLPFAEAIEIAAQIATALDAAHEQGVVHRDLKPANIKIRPDGTVKVLDFGIAKAYATRGDSARVNTVTQLPGAIVGTPSYMSPEQASGGEVDRKTDIWAFGCVLYEMLTGQRVFDGETSSRIVARVLERDPDWGALPRDLPAQIRTLLRQCLEKNVRRRRRDAGALRLELELIATLAPDAASAGRSHRGPGAIWMATASAIAVAAVATVLYLLLTDEPPPPTVTDLTTPPTRRPFEGEISPDGHYVAYIAVVSPDSIRESLYLRDLDTGEASVIPGTAGARLPCWSPDSQSIAFFADEYLQRVDINGGAPRQLAPALNGFGCSWSESGAILFTPSAVTELHIVPASGEGEHMPVTEIDLARPPGDPEYATNHIWPAFVGDTGMFLYTVSGGPAVEGIHLGFLDGTPSAMLIGVRTPGVFVAPDRVVYVENNRLLVGRIDFENRRLTGTPEVIDDSIISTGFSASRSGERFIYRNMQPPGSSLILFDRDGNELSSGPSRNGPEISSDDRWLAFDNASPVNRDIYIASLDGTVEQRQSGDPTVEGYPDFSPDDSRLSYERQRPDNKFFELWQVEVNRLESAHMFRSGADDLRNLIPLDWSVNDYIVYRDSDPDFLDANLLAASALDGDAEPVEVAAGVYEERLAHVSPSGDWIAFDSNQPGRFGVFVQPFPDASSGVRIPVTNSGFSPRWNGDDEIVYLTLDGQLMAAPVTYLDDGLEIGTPVELFRGWFGEPSFNHSYAVTSDGRFLMNVGHIDEYPPPIRLVQNSPVFSASD
jgi:serine/threonine protein kinase